MPEGDSIAGDAVRLRPILVGKKIEAVGGTAGAIRSNSHRILDAEVTSVRTRGKNLLIDLSGGYSVRVHLGMTGRWREGVIPRARLSLTTGSGSVSCLDAPTVDVDRTAAIDRALDRLGPDLLDDFDEDDFIRRARAVDPMPVGRLLLDQRVMAGVGNVYKSELLFLAGINPWTSTADVTDHQLREISRNARELLAFNVGRRRSTTGSTGRGQETWVYGQRGHRCRRCGTTIEMASLDDRVTFWCPSCQQLGASPGM